MPEAKVTINLGGLHIELVQEAAYPDMVTDLCNRATAAFGAALAQAKACDINIMASTWVDYGDDEDED